LTGPALVRIVSVHSSGEVQARIGVVTNRFDQLSRAVSTMRSRRALAGILGVGALALPPLAEARKRKKKIKRNGFGCVNVGDPCKNSGQCCSGICQGKKRKKKCKGHDQSTCRAGMQHSTCAEDRGAFCDVDGSTGNCNTTTGNAGFCTSGGECFECARDADCVAVCGPRAACIRCAGCANQNGAVTACVAPIGDICTFPT
jgi:hypothetical protein